MSEDVFEKPLVMKDFVRRRKKRTVKGPQKSKLYEKVGRLQESKIYKSQSKYLELVNAIAKEKKGTYKVLLDSIGKNLKPKSTYHSVEKALIQVAKRNGADFAIIAKRQVQTRKGIRTYVSYPNYIKWKEENLKLKMVNGELFLEKRTDRPL